MKGFLKGITFCLLALAAVAAVVVELEKILPPARETYEERTEREFRAACAKVGGQTVWNQRQWACLK